MFRKGVEMLNVVWFLLMLVFAEDILLMVESIKDLEIMIVFIEYV